jgi:nucleosome assembly protein 1-like 1
VANCKKDVDVLPVDTKDIKGEGVSGFWLKAMLNNPTIVKKITEKDRPILQYLVDLRLDPHEAGFGFDLTFQFAKNTYFEETELKKSFVLGKPNVIEKLVGTPITWKAGCDVTKTKKKKGKGKKKHTVEVKAESFFNFFETVEAEKKEVDQDSSDEKQEDGDEHDAQAEQMEQDFDLGTTIRDELIPSALEFYLGVVDEDLSDDEEWADESEAEQKDCK